MCMSIEACMFRPSMLQYSTCRGHVMCMSIEACMFRPSMLQYSTCRGHVMCMSIEACSDLQLFMVIKACTIRLLPTCTVYVSRVEDLPSQRSGA